MSAVTKTMVVSMIVNVFLSLIKIIPSADPIGMKKNI